MLEVSFSTMLGVRPPHFFFDLPILILTLILCIHQRTEKNANKMYRETLYLVIVCLMFLILCCILYKIRLFIEELFYIKSDHNGHFWSVLNATLNFNTQSQILIAITFFSFMMIFMHSNYNIVPLMQVYPSSTFFAFAFSLYVLYLINILECRVTKVSQIFVSGGLDPGTSMACSFFYGYLKIVLPASGGNERAGILTSFEKYEGNNKVNIPVKKLFILIPSSSYIPADLREVSNNWLEHSGSLETVILDRAGVKNRHYMNTVYRLRTEGSEILNSSTKYTFLAAEGATPLKTFLEVQHNSHRYASMYREYNAEIIKNFYTTLQNLLIDNPDCKDYCELVYYEDVVNNQRVNPAQVLLKRIEQLLQD